MALASRLLSRSTRQAYAGPAILQSEHVVPVRCFAAEAAPSNKGGSPPSNKGGSPPPSLKGDEMLKNIFLDVKKKFETAIGVLRTEKITIDPDDPAAVSQYAKVMKTVREKLRAHSQIFIFKFSQLGAQALNRLTTVPSVAVWRSPSLNTPQHRNFQSLMIKRLFSTSDGAQVSGTEEKVRIPKFFIDTEGKEYTVAIKVPVGMSIQQVYQENKIEVEGRSSYVSRRTDLAEDEYILVGEADNKYNNKVVRIPSLKKTSVLHIPPNIYLEIPDSK